MEISPHELKFNQPLDVVTHSSLRLTNPSKELLVYKVKTTAPKLYCVRPNAAAVAPGKSLDVVITRQAHPVSSGESSKDKFLILSSPIEEAELQKYDNIADVWQSLELSKVNTNPQKVRVVYGTEGGSSHLAQGATAGAVAAGAGAAGAGAAGAAHGSSEHANTSTTGYNAPTSVNGGYGTANKSLNSNYSEAEHEQYGSQPQSAGTGAGAGAAGYEQSPSSAKGSFGASASSSGPPGGTSPSKAKTGPELTVDDIQGTPGVPPKSQLVDEGNAKTGPSLKKVGDYSDKPAPPPAMEKPSEGAAGGLDDSKGPEVPEGKFDRRVDLGDESKEDAKTRETSDSKPDTKDLKYDSTGAPIHEGEESGSSTTQQVKDTASSYTGAAAGAVGAAAGAVGAAVGGLFGSGKSEDESREVREGEQKSAEKLPDFSGQKGQFSPEGVDSSDLSKTVKDKESSLGGSGKAPGSGFDAGDIGRTVKDKESSLDGSGKAPGSGFDAGDVGRTVKDKESSLGGSGKAPGSGFDVGDVGKTVKDKESSFGGPSGKPSGSGLDTGASFGGSQGGSKSLDSQAGTGAGLGAADGVAAGGAAGGAAAGGSGGGFNAGALGDQFKNLDISKAKDYVPEEHKGKVDMAQGYIDKAKTGDLKGALPEDLQNKYSQVEGKIPDGAKQKAGEVLGAAGLGGALGGAAGGASGGAAGDKGIAGGPGYGGSGSGSGGYGGYGGSDSTAPNFNEKDLKSKSGAPDFKGGAPSGTPGASGDLSSGSGPKSSGIGSEKLPSDNLGGAGSKGKFVEKNLDSGDLKNTASSVQKDAKSGDSKGAANDVAGALGGVGAAGAAGGLGSSAGKSSLGVSDSQDSSSVKSGLSGFEKTISGPAASAGGAYGSRDPSNYAAEQAEKESGGLVTGEQPSSSSSQLQVTEQQVPLPTVFLIALIAFLVGWKFF